MSRPIVRSLIGWGLVAALSTVAAWDMPHQQTLIVYGAIWLSWWIGRIGGADEQRHLARQTIDRLLADLIRLAGLRLSETSGEDTPDEPTKGTK